MESDVSSHDSIKENLVEAAAASLKRLNDTINEMTKWTYERAAMQSHIYRLEVALQNASKDTSSILQSRDDPLVKYQMDEIHRLEMVNNKMKIKLQSLSEQFVKTSLNETSSHTDIERHDIIKEISNLSHEFNDCETSDKLQQLQMDLNLFIEDDKILDEFFSKIITKFVVIIKKLSNELFRVNQLLTKSNNENRESVGLEIIGDGTNEPIIDEIDSDELEFMSCPDEQELRDINMEFNEHEKLLNNRDSNDSNNNNNYNIYYNDYLRNFQLKMDKIDENKQLLFRKNKLKERVLKRSASTTKIKLAIALMKNKKLVEKIKNLQCEFDSKLNSIQTDLAIQTEDEVQRLQSLLEVTKAQLKTANDKLICLEEKFNSNNNKDNHNNNNGNYSNKQLETELMAMKTCNNNITDQLMIEQTTTKEALKQFERSTKEIERLETELEDIKIECAGLKRENGKLKLENSELKNCKMTYKKKNMELGEAGIKERESLETKIKGMKLRINKLMGDLKKLNRKISHNEEIIKDLTEKNCNYQMQIDFFLKNTDDITESFQKQEKINEEMMETKNILEKEINLLQNERENLSRSLEIADEKLQYYDKCCDKNLHFEKLFNEANELNDTLRTTIEKNVIEIDNLTSKISDNDNDKCDLINKIESLSLTVSSLQMTNDQMKNAINTSKVENEKLMAELLASNSAKNSLKSKLTEMVNEKNRDSSLPPRALSRSESLKDKNKVSKGDINQAIENSSKLKDNKGIDKKKNRKLVTNYDNSGSDSLKNNLHITERELSTVKNELTKVKNDIVVMRSNLENGKYVTYDLERENNALKEELAKLRMEKIQLINEIKKARKGKNH